MSALAAPLSPSRRRAILGAHARAAQALVELDELQRQGDAAARDRLSQHEANHVVAIQKSIDEYVATLPQRAISRCPFTKEALTLSIDDAGLDGLWWRAASPIRPARQLPRTFVALTGAMALSSPVERAPFVAKPGPDVPFVIPRLLDGTKATAVISTVGVGAHTGYAIAYFADPSTGIDPANDWGANSFTRIEGWGEAIDDPATFDYDIAARLKTQGLVWIAPGDTGLTLRDGADGCPYVGLRGGRRPQYVQDGEVWT